MSIIFLLHLLSNAFVLLSVVHNLVNASMSNFQLNTFIWRLFISLSSPECDSSTDKQASKHISHNIDIFKQTLEMNKKTRRTKAEKKKKNKKPLFNETQHISPSASYH